MRKVSISLASGLTALIAACGATADSGLGSALDHQIQRSSADSFERPWSDVNELASFIETNHDREGFGGMQAVVGRFTEAEPGIGMNWGDTPDSEEMTILDYGDPAAVVESVHLTFEISERLAPHSAKATSQVVVAVTFDAGFDFDTIEKDYLGLGEVVLFLEQSPVFADRPGTYGILDNGLLIGTIEGDGGLDFPLVRDRGTFVPDDLAVDDLKRG